MAETVACLHRGKVEVVRHGQASQHLESPYQRQQATSNDAPLVAPIVSVTRGRTHGELCYVIKHRGASSVFAQVPGTGHEQRLFHGTDTDLSELDFSFADAALACTVAGANGTSAIAVLADDGKGVRTVTEGDVIDRAPRWAPGGRGEIVYASAGIGRTQAGKAVGRSPFALHRLRFSDNSVEVLMSDAHYDYVTAVPFSPGVLYALRRSYEKATPLSVWTAIPRAFREFFSGAGGAEAGPLRGHELVRITAEGLRLVAPDVVAFDVAESEDIIYSNGKGVFRIARQQATPEPVVALDRVEQLLIYR